MSVMRTALFGRSLKPTARMAAFTAVALGCVAVVEALHGHACTGDGCVLCLAAAAAQVLLAASLAAALAQPLVRLVAELRISHAVVAPYVPACPWLTRVAEQSRAELTPVTCGVVLRI